MFSESGLPVYGILGNRQETGRQQFAGANRTFFLGLPGLELDTQLFNYYIEYMNNHRVFKDQLFEQFARVGRALANPHRLELIDLLAQGERSVEVLAREAAMSVASASQHLQVLKGARMVETRREGLYVYYRLADEKVFEPGGRYVT